ncbi:hypothetical protein HK104_009115 [Borealophlyctis nickersoniae]|nr:hypothetical protein HK104_009115 [Borealophlyctis nickersoniae]
MRFAIPNLPSTFSSKGRRKSSLAADATEARSSDADLSASRSKSFSDSDVRVVATWEAENGGGDREAEHEVGGDQEAKHTVDGEGDKRDARPRLRSFSKPSPTHANTESETGGFDFKRRLSLGHNGKSGRRGSLGALIFANSLKSRGSHGNVSSSSNGTPTGSLGNISNPASRTPSVVLRSALKSNSSLTGSASSLKRVSFRAGDKEVANEDMQPKYPTLERRSSLPVCAQKSIGTPIVDSMPLPALCTRPTIISSAKGENRVGCHVIDLQSPCVRVVESAKSTTSPSSPPESSQTPNGNSSPGKTDTDISDTQSNSFNIISLHLSPDESHITCSLTLTLNLPTLSSIPPRIHTRYEIDRWAPPRTFLTAPSSSPTSSPSEKQLTTYTYTIHIPTATAFLPDLYTLLHDLGMDGAEDASFTVKGDLRFVFGVCCDPSSGGCRFCDGRDGDVTSGDQGDEGGQERNPASRAMFDTRFSIVKVFATEAVSRDPGAVRALVAANGVGGNSQR